MTKNTIPVKDKNGKRFRIKNDDPRWLNGELKHVCNGINWSDESRKKTSNTHKNTTWIHNNENKNKQVKTIELEKWLSCGWVIGRFVDRSTLNITEETRRLISMSVKNKKWINNTQQSKRINIEEIEEYIKNGWNIGRLPFNNK